MSLLSFVDQFGWEGYLDAWERLYRGQDGPA
jgi:hypothetical protein